ncbi:sulfite reductase subunit alpha [Comamonas sp. Y33R10-2]|uniref:sulfite reductase subunit alpha n=1 Tax=Comamonas sp. Y33R10-2 TaxID=2853257 RepID=UPI001C5C9D73|nr:sulfite reductase subunit alpha [Comamonas sp. Y33R10-2]QXZ10597.1 sulfite reductase subunit alpha [Comamonas sp. Y33R10-2]
MTVEWILTPERISGAIGLIAAYAGLCWGIAAKVRKQRKAEDEENSAPQGNVQAPAVLVAYASQTGQAEALARATAHMLVSGGLQVRLLPVQKLTEDLLQQHMQSLWVLSTTGEGDAPDHALGFVQGLLASKLQLEWHQSVVLALGDSEYQEFCAFGTEVHEWLKASAENSDSSSDANGDSSSDANGDSSSGSSSELICVDNMNAQSLQAWQARVGALRQQLLGESAAQDSDADWLQTPASVPFVLAQRRLLNPGSQGGALYQLDWVPQAGALPHWESGDLVSLCVPADPERARDYSIASIVADGSLQMLVRQSVRDDGSPGLASDWLCRGIALGDVQAITVRAHSGFRLGDNAQRPLILIGNGSGLAGLLSHIKARVQQGRSDQWLMFGERSPLHDAICAEQLAQWVQGGHLARLDQAWSRNSDSGKESHYVQDLLHIHANELLRWVEQGAAIYVCGSLNGMGQGVHQTLQAILGEAKVDALLAQGRYRRDVY